MTRTHERRGISTSRLMLSVITVAAMTGWGAYVHSTLSSAQLEQQITALQHEQAQLVAERQKAEEEARENKELQEQLASAKMEIERLTTRSKEAEASLAATQEQLASLQRFQAPPALGNAPGLRGVSPLPTKQDVIAAQEALTRLGFGDLKADGVIGAGTRQAIEEFQRVVGLTVTGELHGMTLQTLMRSVKVVAAQNERAGE